MCIVICMTMISGPKGLKSDAGLFAGGFLTLGPAKNLKKQRTADDRKNLRHAISVISVGDFL